jgi:hypothetical protein
MHPVVILSMTILALDDDVIMHEAVDTVLRVSLLDA